MTTFTSPQQLRSAARSNQKLIYAMLFTTSAAALQKLASDPRFIGANIGLAGILHTWSRDMLYHPHVREKDWIVLKLTLNLKRLFTKGLFAQIVGVN